MRWSYSALYKLTFSPCIDQAALNGYFCREYQRRTGRTLGAIKLWKSIAPQTRPGETSQFTDVVLFEGDCAQLAAPVRPRAHPQR